MRSKNIKTDTKIINLKDIMIKKKLSDKDRLIKYVLENTKSF